MRNRRRGEPGCEQSCACTSYLWLVAPHLSMTRAIAICDYDGLGCSHFRSVVYMLPPASCHGMSGYSRLGNTLKLVLRRFMGFLTYYYDNTKRNFKLIPELWIARHTVTCHMSHTCTILWLASSSASSLQIHSALTFFHKIFNHHWRYSLIIL